MEKQVSQKYEKYLERNQNLVIKIQSLFRSKVAKARVRNLTFMRSSLQNIDEIITQYNRKYMATIFEVYKEYKFEKIKQEMMRKKEEEEILRINFVTNMQK